MLETAAPPCVEDAMITRPKTLPRGASVQQIRDLFTDDHVHLALIVDSDGQLLATLERGDIPAGASGTAGALGFGSLSGRTVTPELPLSAATAALHFAGRRRLAVVDGKGKLRGLLCLKRTGLGYCTDSGVAARAAGMDRDCQVHGAEGA